ncbi:putative flavin containing polyamine oxidase [Aspergillus clavatus NRRL 1]|uniref:Flavin containing polyamine oxidase, putative n=1 Tax=Aspergillus clavatus (strain ATCC 1007 / CBS 513.65 / DSM 816 / NCTC 3887 / NRRL 1 / QM 1276 / 107) TaxID=344612 RepID=A1CMI3_ASPCL|nr:flavin containing polyamine oxidase, putative [Aspergillus clavatus NRRL 1]EAW08770.1 flavin containing polyamine oxidase, putative [Aspergillus clavatus NRRL 1]
MYSTYLSVFAVGWLLRGCAGYVAQPLPGKDELRCTKTTVAILGGGMAGVTAAQALTNASIDDFMILEYTDRLGGRLRETEFGADESGKPYRVELGANWVHGVGSRVRENPIWKLARKYNLTATHSNYSSIRTYNETGYTDYRHLLRKYSNVYRKAGREAGRILTENLQDQTARSGLALAGWRPRKNDMAAQAVEWWNWDWENAQTPETSSFVFGVAGENLTFQQFGFRNELVVDPRGYSAIITGEASTFLYTEHGDPALDPRVRLQTQVTAVEYSGAGVTVHSADGRCVQAAYAICTFSLGVLQNDAVVFRPPLPPWKQTAIHKFHMGTYTKIFMQFDERFWPADTQFFLYAHPTTRGYYPVFQSLDAEGFLPDSRILFVTVVDAEAYRVERQDAAVTEAEILEVLRKMFPRVRVPRPTAFFYPRWSAEPWAYGSYSNWPAGTTLEIHQNLRANVERLWFAGEATSSAYFGFAHGAWYEGREVGEHVAALLRGKCVRLQGRKACGEQTHYELLHGTTPLEAYNVNNGWPLSSVDLS